MAGIARSTRSAARVEVLAGDRVADGLGSFAVLLVPLARPPVQLGHLVGSLVQQVRTKHVCEEMVVAIPPATIVERDQEQVRPVQRLEHGLAAVLAGDGIAQRAAQPVEDRRSRSRKLRTRSGWRCRTSSTR